MNTIQHQGPPELTRRLLGLGKRASEPPEQAAWAPWGKAQRYPQAPRLWHGTSRCTRGTQRLVPGSPWPSKRGDSSTSWQHQPQLQVLGALLASCRQPALRGRRAS